MVRKLDAVMLRKVMPSTVPPLPLWLLMRGPHSVPCKSMLSNVTLVTPPLVSLPTVMPWPCPMWLFRKVMLADSRPYCLPNQSTPDLTHRASSPTSKREFSTTAPRTQSRSIPSAFGASGGLITVTPSTCSRSTDAKCRVHSGLFLTVTPSMRMSEASEIISKWGLAWPLQGNLAHSEAQAQYGAPWPSMVPRPSIDTLCTPHANTNA
mmetsp:Transcript_73464/g.215478  ORF Transcript_73464/g.215478 Transcript_73464/m.215478 type:complete len:208 (+) Transcript_73464:274-897(+)